MSYDVTTIGAENGWRIVPHGAHVVQAWPPDADSPLALKSYNNPEAAQREYAVLRALRDFGVNLGPEALAIQTEQETPQVLMSWLEAAPLARPPAPDEDALWHRLMAAFGAPGEMSFATYTRPVPMQGHGIQNPADIYRQIERILPAEVPESA
ncbi:MAG: phosphotransferase, partial [Anaerolineales bacterium]